MSVCLFANLSFFICLCASCFSEMAVSKMKMMELSELRSYSFLGSMHIVFHLQFQERIGRNIQCSLKHQS